MMRRILVTTFCVVFNRHNFCNAYDDSLINAQMPSVTHRNLPRVSATTITAVEDCEIPSHYASELIQR
jgi:hypothetical protein